MSSKYLNSLSKEEYENLTKKLYDIQNGICFICGKSIDLSLQTTNIDHIKPLANGGKDDDTNFAIAHETCNKSKLDADLRIARILQNLKSIQDEVSRNNKTATLEDILKVYGGSKYNIKYSIQDNILKYTFEEVEGTKIHQSTIFEDYLSKEKYAFIEVPIEYIYHDSSINPRGINGGISKLIKEFYKKNPQLHLSLARFDEADNNKIKVFDGQHKAVAQILLGAKRLVLRLFIEPDVDRLTETNTNAGSTLKQIAFDKSIIRQLNNTLYLEKLDKYRKDKNLALDDWSFSEQDIVNYFKGENSNIKKYIIDNLKTSIIKSSENKLTNYIDMEGRSKKLPISYSAFDKTYLSLFINSKNILSEPMDNKYDTGKNKRFLEQQQLIKLMNIIAEEIYCEKFDPEIGVAQIEDKIIKKRDENITEEHLVAYRMSKEEIMHAWLIYIKMVIENYFAILGKFVDKESLFQTEFEEQLWQNIRMFIRNLKHLPLWIDKSMASTHFAGKNTYEFWETVFKTGVAPNGAKILVKELSINDMMQVCEL